MAEVARRDVVGRPYPGCVRSSVRVPESEVERFVGTAALARSRPYVNPDAIGDVSYSPGSRTLSALVAGSGGRRYRTEVAFGHPDQGGWSRPKLSTCTCPVAMRCKHAAALMLFAGADPDGGADGGTEPVPEWRQRVEEMMYGAAQQAPPRESEVYGLQLSVVADETVDDGWAGGLRPGLG
ncbi:helicase SNF2, partial [Dietzia sp. SLG310A2-38A2]|nr:helicase SNF2 [Dietzia sp. SLG310A2-38A2]